IVNRLAARGPLIRRAAYPGAAALDRLQLHQVAARDLPHAADLLPDAADARALRLRPQLAARAAGLLREQPGRDRLVGRPERPDLLPGRLRVRPARLPPARPDPLVADRLPLPGP